MKRSLKIMGISVFALLMLASCGKKEFSKMSFKDGTYIGHSEGGDHPSYTEVKLVIKDNKIVESYAEFRDSNKEIKDENYGKQAGPQKYAIAQKAVYGMNQYPKMLLEVQDPDEVDALAGATVTNKLYKEAVWDALEKAER